MADSLIDPLENRPLSDRAREALLRAMREGRFPEGRLPPEAELADQLGVSRTTVRAALQSLSADGLISRRRRHGTHVNDHLLRSSMQLNRLVSFAALVEQCGHVASTDPQAQTRSRLEAEQAVELEAEPGEDALVVRRLIRAGGRPVISVTDVVPTRMLGVAADEVRPADTTFSFLAANAIGEVDYATSEFVPRVATTATPEGLELAAGTAFIELHEVHFTRDHQRIALSVVCVNDAYVRLSLLRRGV